MGLYNIFWIINSELSYGVYVIEENEERAKELYCAETDDEISENIKIERVVPNVKEYPQLFGCESDLIDKYNLFTPCYICYCNDVCEYARDSKVSVDLAEFPDSTTSELRRL